MTEKILSKRFALKDSHTIEVYRQHGGYEALRKALQQMSPAQVLEEVKKSNLRGRGGAGFPAGMKWGFLPKDSDKPVYLCVNADESEPGTFKDRYIMERDPHLLIEGIIITCYTIHSNQAYIYIRGEYLPQARILEQAIQEAYANRFLGKNILGSGFDLDLILYIGAGAYICGEETAMLESLEGKKGHPRLKPPFPAVVGLYNCPTIINNVETIANVPSIVEHGGEWYAGLGPPKNGGTRLFAVSGHVKRPGCYEQPMGYSLKKLIYEDAGGILDDLPLKAVIPGGSSVPVLTADEIDINLDFDSVQEAGSMLGSAAVIVMHEQTCIVKATERIINFYKEESCGQCSPCREGTGWLLKIIQRILRGEGVIGDIDLLYDVSEGILGNTICPLGDAVAMPVMSYVTKFRDEFEYFITHKKSKIEQVVS
jgi:NADH-quinone oxidoreductase subunit F